MGLEFQSRAFVHLKASDELALTDTIDIRGVEGRKQLSELIWQVTGRRRAFLHCCREGKGTSFRAPEHVLSNLGSLTHSFGFFSLTADPYDCGDRDRAYVLDRGRFHEVNTREVLSKDMTPPGLYQHFEWCRMCYYSSRVDDFDSIAREADPAQHPELHSAFDIAGWFVIPDGVAYSDDLPSQIDLVACRESVGVNRYSWSGGYSSTLLIGEENIELEKVLIPLVEAFRRLPWAKGLLYLLGRPRIAQIGIVDGKCYNLSPLEPDEWSYHEKPLFSTANSGYEKR
jgi:hypothetical protein